MKDKIVEGNNNILVKNRQSYVDVCKGICMIMVISMHCFGNLQDVPSLSYIKKLFEVVYMPCFFIISGFYIKEYTWPVFFQKKWDSLLKPFIYVYVFSFLIGYILNAVHPGLLKNDVNILNIVYSRIFINGPIWFLTALFVALLIIQLIRRIPFVWIQFICLILIGVIGFYWNNICSCRIPFFFDSGLTSILFIMGGRYLKNVVENIKNKYLLLFLGIICCIVAVWGYPYISMIENVYEINIVKVLLYCYIGSFGIIAISKFIDKNKYIEYIGENSLIYLCFHMFPLMLFAFILKRLEFNSAINFFACLICTVVVTTLIVFFAKRYLKFIFK